MLKKQYLTMASAVALGLAASAAQAATSYTWDLLGSTTNCISGCGSTANARQYNSTVGNQVLTVQALYATGLANSQANAAARETAASNATLRARQTNASTYANLGLHGASNGLGIANPIDTPQTSGVENSTGSQHAIDNYDTDSNGNILTTGTGTHAHDFLLFDFGQVMTPESFQIGFKGVDSDIDFFIGPDSASGLSFTNADGTSNGTTIAGLLSSGWTRVSKDDVPDCTPTVFGCPTTFNAPAGVKGRYMIAAGNLGGTNDAFKFSQVTMQLSSGGSNPIPGTAALLLIGFAGMAYTRRKPSAPGA